MKLIKLSDNHYIIVDDSEVNEGDICYKFNEQKITTITGKSKWTHKDDYSIACDNTNYYIHHSYVSKITHSTQPLELIKPLSISEVEKLINNDKLFTIEDMEYCYNTASRRGQMQEVGLEPDLGFNDYMRKYHLSKIEWNVTFNEFGELILI